jgi:predicted DsbA family dithiol-disulfide isomerase
VRLEQLADEYGDALALEWRSFLLRPEPRPRGVEEFRNYTRSWRRPAALEPAARFREWATEAPPPSHSIPAAVAGKVAASFGPDAFGRYHRALLHAYFAENRTISERDVLVAVAGEVGLPADEFDTRLAHGGGVAHRRVITEHVEAIDTGIFAVPAVIAGGGRVVTGAVELDAYRRLVVRVDGEGE